MINVNLILEIIKQKIPGLQAVYLFGSTGTSYETSESDLDIAILASTCLAPLQKWHLSQEIALLIKRNVDIVDLKEASTVLRMEIISTGKRIYCRDHL